MPIGAIAQQPIEPRDHARLLIDTGVEPPLHRQVIDLPDFVGDGDLIVVNETKVLSARLRGRKSTGGAVEVFLLELEQPTDADAGASEQDWIAMVRPGSRVAPDTWLNIGPESGDTTLRAAVGEHLADGLRRVRLVSSGSDVTSAIHRYGEVPLPPYLNTVLDDPDRYQTVYASVVGSVAAPTAGLHLTNEVLDRCRAKGAQIAAIDLAVGLGTFRPVTVERLADHHMHSERYAVSPETMEACKSARRVIAIGTTTVRALESVAVTGKLTGRTDLLISGRYPWQVVDLLMTNFHQPRSTLLAMIEAFIGPRWREIYAMALAEGYRFLSFGDAMLLTRANSA